jgi:hypothetical protein
VSALRLRSAHWVDAKNFPGSYVTGCNVLSPTNVWVFGGAVAGLGPPIGTWHFGGSSWRQFNTGNLVLFNASTVSATDIWAAAADVSNSSRIQPVIARWNGHSWREMGSIGSALPKVTSTTKVGLDNVKALSASNVWVLAGVSRQSTRSFLVVHWNGHTWSRVRRGSPGYYLPTAVRDGNGGWWSPPYLSNDSVPYLLHRTHNSWARVSLPVRLTIFLGAVGSSAFGITHVPHSHAMLVAGARMQSSTLTGVVLALGRLPA